MAEVSLQVNGKQYAGWKSARVTRSLEAISGSFELEVTDRWANQSVAWPIHKEDECALLIGNEVVITGYVDKRRRSYSADEHSLMVGGRDKTGQLVDCSAMLEKWEFKSTPLLRLAKLLAEPFDVVVSLQAGLALPPPLAKFSVDPGDTAFAALERACRSAALLPISDGRGGLVLTRTGSARVSSALVEGENILAASNDEDTSGVFRHYFVLGQHGGTDWFNGPQATEIKAFAEDETVRRASRSLLVRPEGSVTVAHAKKRAEWEATTRAARADTVRVTVQGWQQANGDLWPVNAFVPVRSPAIDVNGEMLIAEVTFNLDASGGSTTDLKLVRPDAFKPEPVIAASSTGLWKELERGAL